MINLPLNSLIFASNLRDVAGRETDITVIETDVGYYVTLCVDNERRYLTTRRDPTSPRIFIDLNRLHRLLRDFFASPITFRLENPDHVRLPTKKKYSRKKKKKSTKR